MEERSNRTASAAAHARFGATRRPQVAERPRPTARSEENEDRYSAVQKL